MPLEQAVAMHIPVRRGTSNLFIFVPPSEPDNVVPGPGQDTAEGNPRLSMVGSAFRRDFVSRKRTRNSEKVIQAF
jgi:hypothetical protein